MAANVITLKRGETLDYVLDIEITVASAEAWAGAKGVGKGGAEVTDLGATPSGTTAVVAYVTTPLEAGEYWFDCRVTDSGGKIHYGSTHKLVIKEPQSKP